MDYTHYKCPVCGNRRMKYPPVPYNYCDCCGTQFGYNDWGFTHQDLRKRWIDAGCEWWFKKDPPSSAWDPYEQMKEAGLIDNEDSYKKKYTCPVCGNPSMNVPPEPYNYCKCCRTRFGYDDHTHTHNELRRIWIKEGAQWRFGTGAPDPDWDPYEQMRQAGLSFDDDQLER